MFAVTSQLKEMKSGRKIEQLLDYLKSDKLSKQFQMLPQVSEINICSRV